MEYFEMRYGAYVIDKETAVIGCIRNIFTADQVKDGDIIKAWREGSDAIMIELDSKIIMIEEIQLNLKNGDILMVRYYTDTYRDLDPSEV